MKVSRLMYKNLRYYLGYGLLVALVVIPVVYVFTRIFFIHEIDEYLYHRRDQIVEEILPALKISEIPEWKRFNTEVSILPDTGQTEANILSTEYVYMKHAGYNQPFRILYSKVEIEGEKYILTIRLCLEEFLEFLHVMAWFLLLLLVCLMIGLIIVTHLIHKKLWKPFYKTLSLTEQFSIQHSDVPDFQPTGTQEFDQLNRAFQSLIYENLQAYKTQKEFTENASHEMQTPLAVLRSKLDILVQQPDLTEEQTLIIQTLYDATSRMARINKNLLLLNKIENLQFQDVQTINVADTLEASLSFLSEQTEIANITVEKKIVDRDLTVQANDTLFESLINNVITNAIKHNVKGGVICVILEGNQLDVINTGIDQQLDGDMLFCRFVRMNPSSNGSGLGLAIARQICLLYGWRINYSFENGVHRFVITFLTK